MQRRDSTCIFYDILFLASRGITKTRLRRELGLSFRRSEGRLNFLIERGHLKRESSGSGAVYNTTGTGHRLLSFMSMVDEELGTFFQNRKGNVFRPARGADVERGLMDLLFNLQADVVRTNRVRLV